MFKFYVAIVIWFKVVFCIIVSRLIATQIEIYFNYNIVSEEMVIFILFFFGYTFLETVVT